jgi:hypothetical protein
MPRANYIVFLLAAVLAPSFAGGAEDGRRVEIHPHCNVVGWYDDNVSFAPQTETAGDYYTQIEPGIGVFIPNRIMDLRADYTYIRYDYLDRTDLSRDYHKAKLDLADEYEILRGLKVNLGDTYELVPVNLGLPVDTPYNFTQKNTAYLTPRWSTSFSKRNALSAGYYFSRVDYTSSPRVGEDYFGHLFDTLWELGLIRGLTFVQTNTYTIYDYDNLPTYRSFVPMVGLRVMPNGSFTLEGHFGYSYEHDETFRYRGDVYQIAAMYKPSERFDAKLRFTRDRLTDVSGVPFTDDYLDLRFNYRPAHRWNLHALLRYSRYLYAETDQKYFHCRFDIRYRLTEEIGIKTGYVRTQNLDTPSQDAAVSNRYYIGLDGSF